MRNAYVATGLNHLVSSYVVDTMRSVLYCTFIVTLIKYGHFATFNPRFLMLDLPRKSLSWRKNKTTQNSFKSKIANENTKHHDASNCQSNFLLNYFSPKIWSFYLRELLKCLKKFTKHNSTFHRRISQKFSKFLRLSNILEKLLCTRQF